MTLNPARLAEILGTPPPGVVPVPWDKAPSEVGFQFPADYRELINTYGQFSLNGVFYVGGPDTEPSSLPGVPTGFEDFVRLTTSNALFEDLAEQRAVRGCTGVPYPFFPIPGGLLQWGVGEDVYCFWLTEGPDPDAWAVVVMLDEAMGGGTVSRVAGASRRAARGAGRPSV